MHRDAFDTIGIRDNQGHDVTLRDVIWKFDPSIDETIVRLIQDISVPGFVPEKHKMDFRDGSEEFYQHETRLKLLELE